MDGIKRVLFVLMAVLWLLPSVYAKRMTREDVVNTIVRVNTYWQTNNKAEVRSFWDNAAYHTGNMEVWKLLNDQQMLDYSIRWAEYNEWKGAKEADPAKWKYKQYGEGQDYVLFGDWQICFQTYIDLYHITKDERRVARAKEVMGYEADSPQNDYWWWADALYMVMPASTCGQTTSRPTARRTSGPVATAGYWPDWLRCCRTCLRHTSASPSL